MADGLNEANIAAIEKAIQTATNSLNDEITLLLGEQRNLSQEIRLAQMQVMRYRISLAFAQYNTDVASALRDLQLAADDSMAYLKSIGVADGFIPSETAIINAMIQNVVIDIQGLSASAAAKVSEQVYIGALTGRPVKDITQSIKQLLIGHTDRAGQPMVIYAKTIAGTAYSEIDALTQKMVGKRTGLNTFKYVGTLVEHSRDWCKAHVGKILTEDEIKEWENKKWQGKKDGDPFIVRGGWNCRHVFRASIPKETTK